MKVGISARLLCTLCFEGTEILLNYASMSRNHPIPLQPLPPRSTTILPSTTPPITTSNLTTPLSPTMPPTSPPPAPTTVLLRPPFSPQIFSTSSSAIASHLQRHYRWKVKTVALSEIPDILDTNCIIEHDDGTIELDEKMLESEKMVEKLREVLAREGVGGEVRYEGRMRRI